MKFQKYVFSFISTLKPSNIIIEVVLVPLAYPNLVLYSGIKNEDS